MRAGAFLALLGADRNLIRHVAPDFAGPRVAVARSGVATRTRSSGLVELVAPNLPRFHALAPGGPLELLGEGQRQNGIARSADFTQATGGWVPSNSASPAAPPVVTPGFAAGPDGSPGSATRIQLNGTGGFSGLTLTVPGVVGVRSLWLRSRTGPGSLQLFTSLADNTAVTETWARYVVSNSSTMFRIMSVASFGNSLVLDLEAWHAGNEANAPFASTTIPTSGVAETRGADAIDVALTRAAPVTILFSLRPGQAAPAGTDQIALQLGPDANRLVVRNVAGTNAIRLSREAAGAGLVDAAADLGAQTPLAPIYGALVVAGDGTGWAKLRGAARRDISGVPAAALTGGLRLMNRQDGLRPWSGTCRWLLEAPAALPEPAVDALLSTLDA